MAQRFGLPVEPDARVGSLSVGERQRVEILKALYRGARILILDEPTAVLTPQESEALFATLAQMVAQGLSIIFISHKLAEVLRVSHRVAVLRGGKLVAQAPAARRHAGPAGAMDGRARRSQLPRAPAARAVGDAGAARCEQVRTRRRRARPAATTCRCNCAPARSSAIAGVSGNGQLRAGRAAVRHCARAIAGSVTLAGRAAAALAGAGWCGTAWRASRKTGTRVGVVGDLPVWENAVSERLRSPAFSRAAVGAARGRARACAQRIAKRFDVRGAGPATRRRARCPAATCRS